MDDRTIRDWSDRLDRQRVALADPFSALWHRLDQPRPAWLPAGLGLAGAAALLVAVLATAGTGPVAGAAADPARSQVKFAYSQMNVGSDGDFMKFSADVNFDPAKPEAGKVNLTIASAASSETPHNSTR